MLGPVFRQGDVREIVRHEASGYARGLAGFNAPELLAKPKRRADALERQRQLPEDKLCLEPDDAVAEPCEPLITARISAGATDVLRTIHFDDQLPASASEVTDVTCERHLTAERNSELPVDDGRPEQLLRRGHIRAHAGSACGEESLASRGNGASAHGSLSSPAKRPSAATPRAASVPGPRLRELTVPGLAQRTRVPREARPRPGLGRRARERCDSDAIAFEERR